MPARDEYEPAGSDKVQVASAKVTKAGSSGAAYAPRDWAGQEILVLASPDWYEVTKNPDGVWIEWEGGEKARDTIAEDAPTNPQVYVGRAHEGHVVVLALVEDT